MNQSQKSTYGKLIRIFSVHLILRTLHRPEIWIIQEVLHISYNYLIESAWKRLNDLSKLIKLAKSDKIEANFEGI